MGLIFNTQADKRVESLLAKSKTREVKLARLWQFFVSMRSVSDWCSQWCGGEDSIKSCGNSRDAKREINIK